MTRYGWACTAFFTLTGVLFCLRLASAQTPLSYSGTLPDADGIDRSVEFSGQLIGAAFTGHVVVAGNGLQISGLVAADGSVAGTVAPPGGEPVGTFQAQSRSDEALAVTYTFGGTTGSVSIPAGTSPLNSSQANGRAP